MRFHEHKESGGKFIKFYNGHCQLNQNDMELKGWIDKISSHGNCTTRALITDEQEEISTKNARV